MTKVIACSCLNVKISVTEELTEYDRSSLILDDDECIANTFFSRPLCLLYVTSNALHIEHTYLVQEENAGDWNIYKCMACESRVYASRDDLPGSVLVDKELVLDPMQLGRKLLDSNYSLIYKIILPTHVGSKSDKPVIGSASSSHSDVLALIQETLNSFLHTKKTEMEERIAKFQAGEVVEFEKLKARVKRERSVLANLVLNQAAEPDSGISLESSSDALQFGFPTGSDWTASDVSSVPHELRDRHLPLKPRPRAFTDDSDTQPMESLDLDLDFNQLYDDDYDGDVNEKEEPSPEDDDDEEDDVLMMRNLDDDPVFRHPPDPGLMSTSMPIPTMSHFSHHVSSRPKFLAGGRRQEHVNIAESMKQLAFEMRGEEQQLFEKPVPRLKTHVVVPPTPL